MKWRAESNPCPGVCGFLFFVLSLLLSSLCLFPLSPFPLLSFASSYAWAQLQITLSLLATIPVGAEPLGIARSPDGSRVYVANAQSKTISVIDTHTHRVIATYPISATSRINSPLVSLDGTKLYVTEVTAGTVRVLKLPEGEEIKRLKVGEFPQGMALTPDGQYLSIVNTASNTVTLMATETDQVLTHIPVNARPHSLVISADGTRAYVTSSQTHSISVLDLSTRTMIATIDLEAMTRLLGITTLPHTPKLYVADNVSNAVVEIDKEQGVQSRVFLVGTQSSPMEFSPTALQPSTDGQKLYVVGRSGWLSILDVATGTTLGSIQVGKDLRNLVLAPDNTAYVTSFASNTVVVVTTR